MLTKTRKCVAAGIALTIVLAAQIAALSQNQTSDFSLRAIDGPPVPADGLRGELVVLAFDASWLPLTRSQMEGLKKLADQYAGRGVAVYWVSTESESPKSKNYASDDQLRELARKYKLTVLRDPDGAVSKRLGVDQLPSVVILDKQGNVSGEAIGGMDPNSGLPTQLAARLDKLL